MKNIIPENILEEGNNLFPIKKYSDKRCNELHPISNWGEVFYNIKTGKIKEKYLEIIKRSEYSQFFYALNYEYGINDFPKKLNKALEIYTDSANSNIDSMSMYRMYHIYKNDYEKFGIQKRNRIYEKFYLFKCYSFLKYRLLSGHKYLCNRFNILKEVSIHFTEEDPYFKIFPKFILFLKKYYKLYNIEYNDILIIDAVINYALNKDKKKSQSIFNDLCSINNLEAIYKFTCIFKNIKGLQKIGFNILYEQKYYKSYPEIASYLFLECKEYEKALDIMQTAMDNGILDTGDLYYDMYFYITEFDSLMNKDDFFPDKGKLYKLFNILLEEIVIDDTFCFFEYLFLRKICFKHFNLGKEIDKYFLDYTKEIVEFLIKLTQECDLIKRKERIKSYYMNDSNYTEFHLSCGIIYFYGIENIIEKDIKRSFSYFLEFCDSVKDNKSYKRFGYNYIYRAKKYFYEQNQLNDNKNLKDIDLLVTKEKLESTEKELFNNYWESFNNEKTNFSSSFYYFFSRLYNKKIGNNGDKLYEFIYLKKAVEFNEIIPGTGSIICFYRKYKSKILFDKIKDEYKEILKHIENKDSEGYGKDGNICPICFENERDWVCLPCKHLFCETCIKKVEKCPICRKIILTKESFK